MSVFLQAVKKLVDQGKLGKYGKVLDTTPSDLRMEFAPGSTTVKKEPEVVETLSASVSATPTAPASSAGARKVRLCVCSGHDHYLVC